MLKTVFIVHVKMVLIKGIKIYICLISYFRCPKDNALRYNYSLSSVQRLTLSAFRFIAVKSKEIFLHCLVKACLRSDRSSRCAEGCKFEKKRKRASEQEIERLLAVGPIIVSSNPPNEGKSRAHVMSLVIVFYWPFHWVLLNKIVVCKMCGLF